MEHRVQLSLTPQQADAVTAALDLYSRVCTGQLEELSELVRKGIIPMLGPDRTGLAPSDSAAIAEIHVRYLKRGLGFDPGVSLNIFNRDVHASGHRAYEVLKVLEKAVAEHRDPAPAFRSTRYDGLSVRCTNDPVPVAWVQARPVSDAQGSTP
ncbi:hypothetical protein F3K02_12445 [Hydrogenophaga sp. D2P1]|uniref:Uncharacterized protein n=1 Tax=Hydrogenophaga aromaticivorans TaxID=2610898 RepID=A0A7Y8GWB7_9BURK|nr:hypothetical protein [Hydrogenophaga aromaticivorans]NWF46054.1 hypothetical protein [Hydrogenophaga aromaticivorans]